MGETKDQALMRFLAIQQARSEYIQAGLQEIKHVWLCCKLSRKSSWYRSIRHD